MVGLALGIVVVALLSGKSGGGGKPVAYQPFFVGTADRVEKRIRADGPECYQDPSEGDRSFCVDLDGAQFIAVHVVPPGGTKDCLVKWDRREKRYADCHGAAVERDVLARFPVLTREINDKISVFVDVRSTTPPPAATSGQ